jgi:predicted DNA-binding transcriptional regulator AlpA
MSTVSAELDRFLRLPEVLRLTGFSAVSTIYAKMADGSFPPSTRIGARAIGWPASTIAAWLATRPCARNVAAVPAVVQPATAVA